MAPTVVPLMTVGLAGYMMSITTRLDEVRGPCPKCETEVGRVGSGTSATRRSGCPAGAAARRSWSTCRRLRGDGGIRVGGARGNHLSGVPPGDFSMTTFQRATASPLQGRPVASGRDRSGPAVARA